MAFATVILAATLALTGATWIDRDGAVTADGVLVVDGRTLVAAGPRDAVRVPRGARVIDLRGRWIVPGFVDNHVHLGRVPPDSDVWIRAGVTTLVENGSRVRPADMRKRLVDGPAVHACGPIITAKGGYPLVGVKSAPALEVRGASDASEKTRDFILRENPDCIKIAVERGFLQDLSDDGWPALEEAEVEAIVRQAHARGLRVTAHVTQQEEFERAVRAGAGVIAHAPIERLTDDALQLAADRGVVMVSTLALWSDSTLQSAAAQNLVRYVRRGGRVAIGSDYPNWTKPGLPIAELRTLAAAGLSRKELLIALSRNTVSQNATDFVVLQSDPLQSLEALTDVDLVIRGGAVVFSSTELHRPARQ